MMTWRSYDEWCSESKYVRTVEAQLEQRVDNSAKCGVADCKIPSQCRTDNGYAKYCKHCLCRNCTKSDCRPEEKGW